MVYLWKMVIFHGKLLNNQMVSLFPNDETWVFDFDPGTETDHRWNGLAIGWQAQLLVDRALRCTWRFVPAGRPSHWLIGRCLRVIQTNQAKKGIIRDKRWNW